jgi:hypothetical protein
MSSGNISSSVQFCSGLSEGEDRGRESRQAGQSSPFLNRTDVSRTDVSNNA